MEEFPRVRREKEGEKEVHSVLACSHFWKLDSDVVLKMLGSDVVLKILEG